MTEMEIREQLVETVHEVRWPYSTPICDSSPIMCLGARGFRT